MNTHRLKWAAIVAVIWTFAPALMAQLSIPSDGSDGALNVTDYTTNVVDLSQAVTGTWTDASTTLGNGVYDSNQWAVVFKYTSVTIPAHSAVVFLNHPTHAPVVWLVQSNVDIEGQLSLDGQGASYDPINLPEPGPGGFRGGSEALGNTGGSGGFGPGGYYLDHGSYSDYHSYGNVQIVPLIGGSGGSAQTQFGDNVNGGGGGGAILIAASETITINGSLHASGAAGGGAYWSSGGAIRLVADQVLGIGDIFATSGEHPGRIRIEANTTSSNLYVEPTTVSVSPAPLVIFPGAGAPTATIVSIAGLTPPSDPKAAMTVSGAGDDLIISTNGTITITVQTANFPTNGTVIVYVKPRNGSQGVYTAGLTSGTPSLATWKAQTSVVGHFVVQVHAYSN
jgi:hypothetical protein